MHKTPLRAESQANDPLSVLITYNEVAKFLKNQPVALLLIEKNINKVTLLLVSVNRLHITR